MKKIIFLLQLIVALNVANAQVGGVKTYAFLNLPNSAKISALGGFNVSLKDPNIIFSNPALMDSSTANFFNLSYVNYFAGVNWGYSSYTFKPSKYGNFAVGIQYINYGDFTAADEIGNITGSFTASDYIFTALWSYKLDSFWSVGVSLKPILSAYEIYSSFGLASDLGLNYISRSGNFSAGLVFRNFGTQIKPYVSGNYEKLPFDVQFGVSQRLAHAPFRFSLLLHDLNKFDLSYTVPQTSTNLLSTNTSKSAMGEFADLSLRHLIAGVEILPSKSFYIAIGYNYQRRQEMKLDTYSGLTGFSTGLGINLKKFSFNYGIAKYHAVGSSQNFTISLNLNKIFYNGRKNL